MKKKLFLASLMVGAAALTLSSCGSSTINSATPTGGLNLDATVAKAKDYTLTTRDYYNQLRYNASSLVSSKIEKALYQKEYNAILELFKNPTLTSNVSEETRKLLVLQNDNPLYSLTDNTFDDTLTNYEYFHKELIKTINNTLANAVYSTQSAKAIDKLSQKEKDIKIKTFIVSMARKNITLTASDLAYTTPTDNPNDIIEFTNLSNEKLSSVIDDYLLTEAKNLAAKNALYKIADKEYIKEYNAAEDDEETKNSNYLFKDETLEDAYDNTYKTYGTYKIILIQFNSRKEALDAINGYDFSSLTTLDEKKDKYLELYNNYHNYQAALDFTNEKFTYTISKDKNDFNGLSDNIKVLLQTTLEDGDILTEPRNIDGKYVMAMKYDSSYDYEDSEGEAIKWDQLKTTLNEEDYNKLITKIKYYTIDGAASTYQSTVTKSRIYERENNDDKNDDVFIYDPVFEYRFENQYNDDYEYIDAANFNNNLIFKIDDFEYTVTDFYKDASNLHASSIITNYFELNYAYEYYDEFIDSDTHNSNADTLSDAISTFNNGNNDSYDKNIGLDNYLLLSYGYTTKDDVLKYYYDAKECLSDYKSKKVFKEWAVASEDGKYTYNADLATSGSLYNLLTQGNSNYNDIFNINIDHILINIDADGDGSPDDPEVFLKDLTQIERTNFENAVVELMRAIYSEATYIAKKVDKKLFDISTYIKTQYEEGNDLQSDNSKNWDDYKTYNFLLTVEQLASSGDITQDSVSSFVVPFKEYVENVFKVCEDSSSILTSYTYGRFIYYQGYKKATGTAIDGATYYEKSGYDYIKKDVQVGDDVSDLYITEDSGNLLSDDPTNLDTNLITMDTLCPTSFGYHLLILNSYKAASKTKYTQSEDDKSGSQSAIELLLYEDSDDSSKNIYITTDSYNDQETQANFKQFLIWYIQKANGASSSLDSDIDTLMGYLFSGVYNTYTSDNFQNVLLIDYLNITVEDENIKNVVSAERNFYANLVTGYDDTSDYYNWVFSKTLIWNRPDQK